MSKKQISLIILSTVLITFVLNIFAGRWLTAKVSTLPLLNRLKILSPQAPIVITNQQTIRVNNGEDVVQTAQQIKSKISTIILIQDGMDKVTGSAVNLTSDGAFVAVSSSINLKLLGNYYLLLNDGRSAKITNVATDSATSLVFLKAQISGVPVANFGNSANLSVGDKVIFTENSLQNYLNKAELSFVVSAEADLAGTIFHSDAPSRGFFAIAPATSNFGDAVVNTSGEIVGIWDGSNIVSSDVLKRAMSLYFNNSTGIVRPMFGFDYSIITQNESQLLSLPQGAKVVETKVSSPARQAGLLVGDVITAVNGQSISESNSLEPMLEQVLSGGKLQLTLTRGKQSISLSLTAGELK